MRSFAADKARGRLWEARFAAHLTRHRYCVVPTYQLDGDRGEKAPVLLAASGALVLPDLLAFRDGAARWFECKSKARADHYRKGGYAVTGFSRRLFREYERVAALTGAPVLVAFLHERENEVRGGTLTSLLAARSHEGELDRGGTIFFRWDSLAKWATADEIRGGAT